MIEDGGWRVEDSGVGHALDPLSSILDPRPPDSVLSPQSSVLRRPPSSVLRRPPSSVLRRPPSAVLSPKETCDDT